MLIGVHLILDVGFKPRMGRVRFKNNRVQRFRLSEDRMVFVVEKATTEQDYAAG